MNGVKLTLRGQATKGKVRAGAAKGLRRAGEHLLQVSREVTPLEEGPLRRSGKVTVDRTALEASVSYDTPYAVRQHEELSYRHDPGQQAKYLEEPLYAEAETLRDIIATGIRRGVSGIDRRGRRR